MFEQAFLEGAARSSRQKYATVVSFGAQVIVTAVVVAIPLLYTQALPGRRSSIDLQAPNLEPATRAETRVVKVTRIAETEVFDGKLLQPREVPGKVKMVVEQETGVPAVRLSEIGAILPSHGPADGLRNILSSPVPLSVPAEPVVRKVRVSEGVAAGFLQHQVKPVYPHLAVVTRVHGAVVLHAVIAKDGSIENLRLVSGHPMLVESALNAVRQWRYRPYLLNGQPVEVETQIKVNFTLAGR